MQTEMLNFLAMPNSVQNMRLVRLLIMLVVIILTIFMYASYYSSRSLSLPHIHTMKNNITTLIRKNTIGKLNVSIKDASPGYTNTNSQYDVANIIVKRHREPTIDVDISAEVDVEIDPVIDDHELMKDQQYQQFVENNNENEINHNNSVIKLLHVEKIVDSDVLIPTLNLQKFLNNADKILKNLTSLPNELGKPQENKVISSNVIKNVSLEEIISKISTNTGLKNSTTVISTPTKKVSLPFDLSQGIPTRQIYESGHLDNEINIEKMCPSEGIEIKVLIIITSAQNHQEARLAIRQTWGHYGVRRDVSTLFIIGRSNNHTLDAALTQENFIYGDLIRGQFMDTYNNLTLKTISALEWVDKHCKRAKYVLKTDDDMFINVPKLLSFLDKLGNEKRVIYGRLAKKWKPIRNTKSKYYVSRKQFSASIFPPFTTGPAYVLSSDTIHGLYHRALQQTYLKLEDVFTTGIIAQQIGIRRVHVNEFLNRRIAFNPCNIRKTISVHMIKSNEQFDLWKKLLDKTTVCK